MHTHLLLVFLFLPKHFIYAGDICCGTLEWRRISIARVLSIALAVVVLFDPWSVNAPGFWLSFAAVDVIAYALSGK